MHCILHCYLWAPNHLWALIISDSKLPYNLWVTSPDLKLLCHTTLLFPPSKLNSQTEMRQELNTQSFKMSVWMRPGCFSLRAEWQFSHSRRQLLVLCQPPSPPQPLMSLYFIQHSVVVKAVVITFHDNLSYLLKNKARHLYYCMELKHYFECDLSSLYQEIACRMFFCVDQLPFETKSLDGIIYFLF